MWVKTVKFYGKLPHFTKKEYEENYEIGLKKDCNIFVPEEYLQDYKNALGTDYMNIFAWNPTYQYQPGKGPWYHGIFS